MANLSLIKNLVVCGFGAVLGTGTKGCKPFFKKVTSFWLTEQGFKYDDARVLNKEYIDELQAEGNLIVVKGIKTFSDNSEEDVYETLDDGTKQLARLGLYEFAMKFIQGLHFNAALRSLSTFAAYDITLIDRDGNILGTRAADGSLKGITLGYIQQAKLEWGTDSTGSKEGVMMQLTERDEIDINYVFIDNKSLDFNANMDLFGVNEINLEVVTPLLDAAVELIVKATYKQNGKVFSGADFEDFAMFVDGVSSDPTAGDDSVLAGTYPLVITAAATNEIYTIELYDTGNNREAIDIGGDLFKSNQTGGTVV